MADEETIATEGELKPSKKKLIIIIVAAVLVLGALIGGIAFWLLSGDDANNGDESIAVEEVLEQLEYYDLNPPFVMSYLTRSGQRYIQAGITVATNKAKVLEVLEQHEPKIRSEILRIIGEHGFNELRTQQGKEKLLTDLRDRLEAIVREEAQIEGVKAVLFNVFVIQ